MRSFTSSKGSFQFEVEPAITQGRILTRLTQILLRTQNFFSKFILHKHKPNICRIYGIAHKTKQVQNLQNSEFILRIHTSQTQTQHLQNLQNCSQNKRGSEFAELRNCSQNSFFHKHKPQHLQNLQNCLQNKKRGSEFCRTQKFSEFNSSQTKPKFAELLRKKKLRNLHNSEFILRINSSETNPKSAEFAELFCVCVCVVSCLLLQCRRFFFFFFSSSSVGVLVSTIINSEKVGRERED